MKKIPSRINCMVYHIRQVNKRKRVWLANKLVAKTFTQHISLNCKTLPEDTLYLFWNSVFLIYSFPFFFFPFWNQLKLLLFKLYQEINSRKLFLKTYSLPIFMFTDESLTIQAKSHSSIKLMIWINCQLNDGEYYERIWLFMRTVYDNCWHWIWRWKS